MHRFRFPRHMLSPQRKAACKKALLKYWPCISTLIVLGGINLLRAFQHSSHWTQALMFLWPVAIFLLLKFVAGDSRAQFVGPLMCVCSSGMGAIMAWNLDSMVTFGNDEWSAQIAQTIRGFQERGQVRFAADVEGIFVDAIVDQSLTYNPLSGTLVFPFLLLNVIYLGTLYAYHFIISPQVMNASSWDHCGNNVVWTVLPPIISNSALILLMVCRMIRQQRRCFGGSANSHVRRAARTAQQHRMQCVGILHR